MTRIAQVHWAALPTAGGVEVHLDGLVRGLRAAGEEVMFFAGTPGARDAVFQPALQPGGSTGEAELTEILRDFDVIHAHNPQWHRPDTIDAVLGALDGSGWRGTWVFSVHNLADDDMHRKLLHRWTVERGHPLVAYSSFVAEHLRTGVPGADVRHLPLVLPADEGPSPDWAEERVILQPTRLSAWKGSHVSLTAVVELLEAGHTLRFVHAGSEHLLWNHGLDQELLDRVAPWRESGHIRFTHYPPEHSWAAIRAAGLVLHPTTGTGIRGEPYSLSVAQSVLSGRPVVVTRSGNLPALVDGYPAARVVEPGDVAGVRDAIEAHLAGRWPSVPIDAGSSLWSWHHAAVPRHQALYREVSPC